MFEHWKIAEIIKYSILVSVLLYLVPIAVSKLFSDKFGGSDTMYLIDPKTEIHKNRPNIAFRQCNSFVVQKIEPAGRVEFPTGDYKAWNLSSGKYLIQSHFYQLDELGESRRKKIYLQDQV